MHRKLAPLWRVDEQNYLWYTAISNKTERSKKMEHRNSTDSIGELFLITKNHYDFFNHVMTILLKSKMNNAPITDKDFRLCEEWLGLIADEYLDVSDRFHARLDAKERMD